MLWLTQFIFNAYFAPFKRCFINIMDSSRLKHRTTARDYFHSCKQDTFMNKENILKSCYLPSSLYLQNFLSFSSDDSSLSVTAILKEQHNTAHSTFRLTKMVPIEQRKCNRLRTNGRLGPTNAKFWQNIRETWVSWIQIIEVT